MRGCKALMNEIVRAIAAGPHSELNERVSISIEVLEKEMMIQD